MIGLLATGSPGKNVNHLRALLKCTRRVTHHLNLSPNQRDIVTLSGVSLRSNPTLPLVRIDSKQETNTSTPSSTAGRMKSMKLAHLFGHRRWEIEAFLPDGWHPCAFFCKNNIHYLHALKRHVVAFFLLFFKDTLINEGQKNDSRVDF